MKQRGKKEKPLYPVGKVGRTWSPSHSINNFFTNLKTIYIVLPTENLFQLNLIFHLEQKFRHLSYWNRNGTSLPFLCLQKTSVFITMLYPAKPGMASESFSPEKDLIAPETVTIIIVRWNYLTFMFWISISMTLLDPDTIAVKWED